MSPAEMVLAEACRTTDAALALAGFRHTTGEERLAARERLLDLVDRRLLDGRWPELDSVGLELLAAIVDGHLAGKAR